MIDVFAVVVVVVAVSAMVGMHATGRGRDAAPSPSPRSRSVENKESQPVTKMVRASRCTALCPSYTLCCL
jgi:hypothetical protein